MDTKSGRLFSRSKIGSNYRDDKDLNKIETDYRDNKDLNQVETNYGDNEDDIDIENNYGDNEDDVEVKTDYGDNKESIFLEAAAHQIPSLPRPYSADVPDPGDDTAGIAEFDIMRSSLLAELMAVGPGLLTSAANWEHGSTQNICTRMPEVSYIHHGIYVQFGLKARPWQVSVLIDICQKKRNVCALASTNAGKNLVYQAISVITGESVLVISPTIALMEDQVIAAL